MQKVVKMKKRTEENKREKACINKTKNMYGVEK
jgi:hypothetical protein